MKRRPLLAILASGWTAGCLRLTGSGDSGTAQGTTVRTGGTDAGVGDTAPTASQTDAPDRSDTETARQTEEETPTESSTEVRRDPEYPLGLSEDGVTGTFVANHRNLLEGESFKRNTKKINVDAANIWEDKTYRYDEKQAIGSTSYQGPITIYRSPDVGVWREQLDDGYTYGSDQRGGYLDNAIDWGVMSSHFKAADWGEPEIVRAEFPGRFELSASGADNPDQVLQFEDRGAELQAFEAEMVIDERGFIRTLDTNRSVVENGSEETSRYIYSISDFGDISVERPAWVDTAQQQAPTATAEFTDERQFVQLNHESGNAIMPETELQFEAGIDNEVGRVKLSERMEAGDVAYVYRLSDGETRVSINSRPSDVSPETLSENLYLKVHRKGLDYFDELEVA